MSTGVNRAVSFCLRLAFRVVGCLIAALCASLLLGRTLGVLFDAVPVRLVFWLVRTYSPETVIDGETAYDVRLGDSIVFYGALFFVLFWYISGRLRNARM